MPPVLLLLFKQLAPSKMSNNSVPVVILIINNDGYISYQAYLPDTYDQSNPNEFNVFLARVYNHISYDCNNALNNNTDIGKLLEVHHRHNITPPTIRSPLCYFSTYIHPHCNYKPIHINSPFFFNASDAQSYSDEHPELCHMSCQLRYI